MAEGVDQIGQGGGDASCANGEDVVVLGAGDGELADGGGTGGGVAKTKRHGIRDHGVVLAMGDDDGAVDIGDFVDVEEMVTEEKSGGQKRHDKVCHVIHGGETGDEHQSADGGVFMGQIEGDSAAERPADDDDLIRIYFGTGQGVIPKGGCSGVAVGLGGFAGAGAVAGVVNGEDVGATVAKEIQFGRGNSEGGAVAVEVENGRATAGGGRGSAGGPRGKEQASDLYSIGKGQTEGFAVCGDPRDVGRNGHVSAGEYEVFLKHGHYQDENEVNDGDDAQQTQEPSAHAIRPRPWWGGDVTFGGV